MQRLAKNVVCQSTYHVWGALLTRLRIAGQIESLLVQIVNSTYEWQNQLVWDHSLCLLTSAETSN